MNLALQRKQPISVLRVICRYLQYAGHARARDKRHRSAAIKSDTAQIPRDALDYSRFIHSQEIYLPAEMGTGPLPTFRSFGCIPTPDFTVRLGRLLACPHWHKSKYYPFASHLPPVRGNYTAVAFNRSNNMHLYSKSFPQQINQWDLNSKIVPKVLAVLADYGG